ncbi:MAG: hypothetical protein AAF725_17235 [Acidobacteriota bacterium]
MTGWRRFFLVAGLFNIAGGLAGFWNLEKPFLEAGMAPPLYPFAHQLLFLCVMIFGVGYLMVWRDPLRHRGIVWLGLLSKIAGLGMTFWALGSDQLPASSWWQPLVADLPWAAGFGLFLATTPAALPLPDSTGTLREKK